MSTFENDLRLEEIGTGERSGTWGTATNVNLELIANALSYSATGEAIANASTHTITMADGAADEARCFYLKCTGGGQACTVTLAPNTLSKVWMIENTTSYTLTFSQGSGANVAILAGQVKVIGADGAGSAGAIFDLMQDLAIPDLFVDDDVSLQSDGAIVNFGANSEIQLTHIHDIGLRITETGGGAPTLQFRDSAISISSSADATLDIASDGAINLTAGTDVVIPANIGLTFGTGEKIEGDSTDLTITSGAKINLTATSDIVVPADVGITFGTGEKIEGNNTDLTVTSGADINLTATADVNIPSGVGLTFGNDGEKIEGDGTDLTIAGNNINLTAVADIVIPADVGLTFGTGEKIEGDSTDLTITSGAKINLTATSDIVVPANVGITFGTGEKIEGDSTDLTITSGAKINLTATSDVHIPNAVGLVFGDGGEHIETDNTNLTVTSGGNVIVAATTLDLNGTLDVSGTGLVTGVLTTTATQVATGGITSGSNIVSDTDSTDDLGTTSVRWANLFVDAITATDQITATGFTGTLDGILGSGAAAAATVTTLNTSGAVNLNLVTDSTSSTSGALIVDGGVGIAKKLYVGTDLDVDGTTNLDAVDIDGAVQLDATLTIGANDQGYDVIFYGDTAARNVMWDSSADSLEFTDNVKATFGTDSDLQLYHDNSNAYVANSAGELRLATLTSGIAIAIGHSTSEVTFGDNVTVTGDFTVNGTTTTIATTNLTVTDPLVKFGQTYVGSAFDQGFIVTRGNGSATNTANKGFIWDESADEFAAVAANTEDGTTAGNVTINSYADMQVAKLTGASLDISGAIDVAGTTNLDVVDIDGAVNMATTALVTGVLTTTAATVHTNGITMPDSAVAKFGTGSDLQIFHDGSNARLNNATGVFNIQANDIQVTDASNTAVRFIIDHDGATTAFFNGGAKLATASGGVTVTGEMAATTMDLSSNAVIDGTALVTGVLTTTAATVFNGGFAANDGSTITTADNTTQLTLISTEAGAAKGPMLDLYRNSASPAAGDDTGRINFQGENDAGETITYSQVFSEIAAEGDGVESGRYKVGTMVAGTFRGRMDMTATETIFNEESIDLDFRVESNAHDNIFFVDGGNDGIGIGNSTIIDWSTNYPGLQIGQAGSLWGHKSSNQMGYAMNWGITTGNVFIADGIASRMVMDTSKIGFDSSASGSAGGAITAIELFKMTPTAGSVFNEGSADLDFRVESNGNANMLFVDGGNDVVTIGGTTGETGDTFAVTSATNAVNTRFVSTNDDANGVRLILQKTSSGPADNDEVAEIDFLGKDSDGNDEVYGLIQCFIADVTSGTEDGILRFTTTTNATSTNRLDITPTETVFNEGGINTNFRVESDSGTNMFFVDGGNNRVYINDNTGPDLFYITGNADSTAMGIKIGTNGFNGIEFDNASNSLVGRITINSSSTAYVTSSDYRLKENVDYSWDATTRLKQLKPARFNFIVDETNTLVDGFLAHEVSSIVPEAITGAKDAVHPVGHHEAGEIDAQGIDHSKLVPLLVKTIQELEARITALEG